MSAFGPKRTCAYALHMSAFWGKADRLIALRNVCTQLFLHIITGPDNTNNVLALAFGVLIVLLVVVGSAWIMTNLNDNLMPSQEHMNLQMQR